MGQETIHREVSTNQVSGNSPSIVNGHFQYVRAQFFGYPCHIVLVLFAIESTSAVYQQATGLQGGPNIIQDSTLPLPTNIYIVYTPFFDGHFVLAEHSLARARYIGKDYIKQGREFGKVGRVVIGYNYIGIPPLDEVFGQDLRTVTHHFVGHQHTSFGEYTTREGGLPPRSRTKVEHHHRFLYIGLKHLFYEHRGSFLYIITSGMKEGVERKGRSMVQIQARWCPRDRCSFYGIRTFLGIRAYAYGHFPLKCFFEFRILLIA